jgi:hypothetical protein
MTFKKCEQCCGNINILTIESICYECNIKNRPMVKLGDFWDILGLKDSLVAGYFEAIDEAEKECVRTFHAGKSRVRPRLCRHRRP